MYGSGYVWMVTGATMYGGSIIQDVVSAEVMGCTTSQLIDASWGSFLVDFYTVSRDDDPTISGKVGSFI